MPSDSDSINPVSQRASRNEVELESSPPDKPAWIVNYEDPRGIYPWRRDSLNLRECADRKHDQLPIRVGPFELTANLNRPLFFPRQRLVFCVTIWILMLLWFSIGNMLDAFVSQELVTPLIVGETILWFHAIAALYPVLWRQWTKKTENALLLNLMHMERPCDQPVRVFVRGSPSELIPFAKLPDAGFEPWIRRFVWRRIVQDPVSLSLLLGVLAVLGGVFVAKSGWGRVFVTIPLVLLYSSPLLLLFLYGIPNAPRYIRIIPGRLDILEHGWFTNRVYSTEQFILRNARTSIDLTEKNEFVHIFTEGRVVTFHRKDVPRPLEFAVAIAWATATTAPTPDIPMDRLVG